MIQFDQKIYFYALLLLPIMLLVFLGVQLWKKKTQRSFSDGLLLNRLAPKRSAFKAPLKFSLQLLGVAAIVIALVNPKAGTKLDRKKRGSRHCIRCRRLQKYVGRRHCAQQNGKSQTPGF